jgi:hypothetical protein
MIKNIINYLFGNKNKMEETIKKSIHKMIEEDNTESIEKIYAKQLSEKTKSREVAKQFILEEMQGARLGNAKAQEFVKNSGFSEFEIDLQINSEKFKDDVEELWQMLNTFCMAFYPDRKKMSDLRLMIVDNYMKIWKLGKYKINDKSNENNNQSSGNKIIITDTSSFEQEITVGSKEGFIYYFSKIKKLSLQDICIELSNVMAIKFNLTSLPINVIAQAWNKNEQLIQQQIIEMNDRALIILMVVFGQSTLEKYEGGDTRALIGLLDKLDEKVASEKLPPMEHGCTLLQNLKKELKITKNI